MQTFIVKMGCLFLFGFIFFMAYQTNKETNTLSTIDSTTKSTTVLTSNITTGTVNTELTEQVITSPLKFN